MSCRIFCWQGEVFQGTDMMSVQSPAPVTSVRAVSTQCFYNLDSSCPENQKHGAGSSKGKEKKKKSWLERQEELCWRCAGAWLCCTVNEPGVKEQSDAGVGKGFRQCARWLAFANFCIAKFLFFYVSSCTLLFLHLIHFFCLLPDYSGGCFFASKPSNVNLYLGTSREVCAGQAQQEKELPVPLMASKRVPVRCFPASAEGAEFAGYWAA